MRHRFPQQVMLGMPIPNTQHLHSNARHGIMAPPLPPPQLSVPTSKGNNNKSNLPTVENQHGRYPPINLNFVENRNPLTNVFN